MALVAGSKLTVTGSPDPIAQDCHGLAFVTLGHSDSLSLDKNEESTLFLSYPERGEEKDFDVKGALSSLAGRLFIVLLFTISV